MHCSSLDVVILFALNSGLQVCVEAGMLALRRDATSVTHEDFVEGITAVQAKKKTTLNYYA
jgi:ATP-dependent 26S proteasome regulatory subunit